MAEHEDSVEGYRESLNIAYFKLTQADNSYRIPNMDNYEKETKDVEEKS